MSAKVDASLDWKSVAASDSYKYVKRSSYSILERWGGGFDKERLAYEKRSALKSLHRDINIVRFYANQLDLPFQQALDLCVICAKEKYYNAVFTTCTFTRKKMVLELRTLMLRILKENL